MEGLIKNITHEKEFNSAVESLIDNKVGDKTILRYGKTLWQYVHDKKPDCRHGVQDNEKARLSIDDATFWINQITNYAHYIVDINR